MRAVVVGFAVVLFTPLLKSPFPILQELKQFKKIVAAGVLDEQELLSCLTRMVRESTNAGKRELMRNIHVCPATWTTLFYAWVVVYHTFTSFSFTKTAFSFLQHFVALCSGKKDFKYPLSIVSSALDLIRSICRIGSEAVEALCATGGVRVLFVALTCAYYTRMSGGEDAGAAKDLVEKVLGVLDEVVAFDETLVVLPFDVPKAACAAAQLAEVKALSSITMLLSPEHGFAHKRSKVLGIISAVTALKSGARRIVEPRENEASCVDQLLFFAAKSDSRSSVCQHPTPPPPHHTPPQDYARATMCIRNLVRHVPAVRQRVLSTEAGIPGLSNLPRLRDQFIEIVDGGAIGYPPRTQSGPARETTAVSAGLDTLRHLLESSDSKALTNEALVDSNQRGVLALLGVMARCDSKVVREKASRIFGLLDQEAFMYANMMHSYTGSGEHAEKWGTGFRVAQEFHAREMKDKEQMRGQQQKRQQFMMQQRMMAEQGMSPEEMAMMGGMGGMGGGMPPGMPPGMTEEMMMQMMMGGGMGQ